MNRADFQALAEIRIKEARALLDAGFPEGAYYLAGYAVECALKACIAKRTLEHDFPDKKLANDSHTHDLGRLVDLARLKTELDSHAEIEEAWDIVQEWSEASRYEQTTDIFDVMSMLQAIETDDGKGGLLPWLRQRW
jgi:hypothetical protein